jgi:hypothetical protein
VLNAARQAVPAVDYALGVAGISAATAIVVFFIGRTRASIAIVALVFIGMVLLFTFSRLAVAQDPPIRLAGVVLLWGVLAFFLIFLGFTVTAFLSGRPAAWANFLGISDPDPPTPARTPPTAEHGAIYRVCLGEFHQSCVQTTRYSWTVMLLLSRWQKNCVQATNILSNSTLREEAVIVAATDFY